MPFSTITRTSRWTSSSKPFTDDETPTSSDSESSIDDGTKNSLLKQNKVQTTGKSAAHIASKPVEDSQGPQIKVIIGKTDFMISQRILEEKVPQFLEACKGMFSVTYPKILNDYWAKKTALIFEHWLRHGKLPEIDENDAPLELLKAMMYLYCVVRPFKVNKLMDLIMDTCVKRTKWKSSCMDVDFINSYYLHTSGPCGLRLFLIRDLVYHLSERPERLKLKPLDYELISRNPTMMKDYFKEMADQGYAGAPIKPPTEYPACCYYDARFIQ